MDSSRNSFPKRGIKHWNGHGKVGIDHRLDSIILELFSNINNPGILGFSVSWVLSMEMLLAFHRVDVTFMER